MTSEDDLTEEYLCRDGDRNKDEDGQATQARCAVYPDVPRCTHREVVSRLPLPPSVDTASAYDSIHGRGPAGDRLLRGIAERGSLVEQLRHHFYWLLRRSA